MQAYKLSSFVTPGPDGRHFIVKRDGAGAFEAIVDAYSGEVLKGKRMPRPSACLWATYSLDDPSTFLPDSHTALMTRHIEDFVRSNLPAARFDTLQRFKQLDISQVLCIVCGWVFLV